MKRVPTGERVEASTLTGRTPTGKPSGNAVSAEAETGPQGGEVGEIGEVAGFMWELGL